uniref:NADH-ubiquinone oxidoreductase chain 4L n=1 Tax=Platynereis cf. australis PA-2020 TaxID=2759233 RepID=A0A7G9UJ03_9ANNE|nr:NADH dehydrogenase subunit 4L [Platynereis cf. australis PA-2020]QNN93071.1 NADH dehydrogenase subunit 4L [Platynereis cf. australis PA-2020]QNN93084.1 NADH dehydrogenase subunit 4L [Platynereis cf. australis PA-2020]QNN93097.1 NADH dehydrogenase subunit 4L [Platynereis cf. australis PA-2020]
MMTWMMTITPILVMLSITCVIFQRQHLLMALLALEAMILSLIIMMIVTINTSWSMFIIVMLAFGACEASLGLACMTSMSRSYGNDRLNSLSLNKC